MSCDVARSPTYNGEILARGSTQLPTAIPVPFPVVFEKRKKEMLMSCIGVLSFPS
jgi:hypothetical protein